MTYPSARRDFLELARAIQARRPEAEVRSLFLGQAGENPVDLFVDEIFIPAPHPSNKLLILTSGLHGLEASFGSSVQRQFLRDLLEPALQRGLSVWIVHGLNPWGWLTGRRVTEENINLNRNFVDFDGGPPPPNLGYKKLAPFFEASAPVRFWPRLHVLRTMIFLLRRIFELGVRGLSQAISKGQFTNPRGLEYGGVAPTAQTANFKTRFADVIKPYREIVALDLHTGLGRRGRLHLLTGFDVRACVDSELFARLFHVHEEVALYEFNAGDEVGFYQTVGDINTFMATQVSQGGFSRPETASDRGRAGESAKKLVSLTLEFGTLGNGFCAKASSLSRLWLENQGFQFGYGSAALQKSVKRRFRELFEPDDAEWTRKSLILARAVLENVVNRF